VDVRPRQQFAQPRFDQAVQVVDRDLLPPHHPARDRAVDLRIGAVAVRADPAGRGTGVVVANTSAAPVRPSRSAIARRSRRAVADRRG
jgi:hypothetical protein